MGPAQSAVVDVRVTDRKSLIKEQCIRRISQLEANQHQYRANEDVGPWQYVPEGITNLQPPPRQPNRGSRQKLLQAASGKDPGRCRGGENSLVFMEPGLLPRVVGFLVGGALVRCFEACPLWFVIFYKTLDQIFGEIDAGFSRLYGNSLVLEYARTDWSPVHITEAGIRIDRILIARVTDLHVNRCTKLAYGFQYASPQTDSMDAAPLRYDCAFKFDTFPRGQSRSFWIHKDICRFHGDETRVAATQNITPVCVNDRIEIAVNLFNAMGFVDVKQLVWHPLEVYPVQRRACPIEQELFDWYDLEAFQSQSVERLQIPDFFGPQLVHYSTEFAGIDVAVSRTRLRAEKPGVVPQGDRILGARFEVLPRNSPIILPLKRAGLQHDRFTKIQLRQGDDMELYISQGGKMT